MRTRFNGGNDTTGIYILSGFIAIICFGLSILLSSPVLLYIAVIAAILVIPLFFLEAFLSVIMGYILSKKR